MSESTLEVLRRIHDEQKHRLFPKSTTSRPEEYSNLYAEMGRIRWIRGRPGDEGTRGRAAIPHRDRAVRPSVSQTHGRTAEIRTGVSGGARPIIDEFRFLERIPRPTKGPVE